jgi:hypothetical protein
MSSLALEQLGKAKPHYSPLTREGSLPGDNRNIDHYPAHAQ